MRLSSRHLNRETVPPISGVGRASPALPAGSIADARAVRGLPRQRQRVRAHTRCAPTAIGRGNGKRGTVCGFTLNSLRVSNVHGVRLDLWAFVALETEGLAILSGRCGLSIQQPPLKQHLQGRRHRGRCGPEAGEPSLFIVGQRSTKNRKECHYERALQESEAKPWTRSGSGYGYLCRCWGAQCRRGAAGLAAKVICSYNLNYG